MEVTELEGTITRSVFDRVHLEKSVHQLRSAGHALGNARNQG